MDARRATERIVAVVMAVGMAAGGRPVYSGAVYIYGGQFNLPITDVPGPGFEMTEAPIEIPDHLTISDLDVRINITHDNVFDLQLFLQSPHGTRLLLNMFDPETEFGVYENYSGTIFDDEAEFSISEGEAPFTGRFRPRAPNLLSVFDSLDCCGTWQLQIWDMFDLDTGTLDTFELIITTPEPATVTLLLLGITISSSVRDRRRGLVL
ncbi:MAG: proprotein convertase P-domain-containing protein [Planctomycetota bacterium]|jgi:subtilisin-like proprotein convertase family protein